MCFKFNCKRFLIPAICPKAFEVPRNNSPFHYTDYNQQNVALNSFPKVLYSLFETSRVIKTRMNCFRIFVSLILICHH